MPNPSHPRGFAVGDVTDGLQGSSAAGHQSAIVQFDIAMVAADYPKWADISDDYASADNALMLLVEFGNYLANETNQKTKGGEYTSATLVKYFEYVVADFKKRYKNRKGYFEVTDSEINEIKSNISKFVAARTQTGTEPDDVAEVKCAPMFGMATKTPETTVLMPTGDPNDPVRPMYPVTDLSSICDKLMESKQKGAHAQKLQLCLTRSAVGRGGEVKFIQWRRMWWERKLQCCLARWFIPKQLKVSLTSFMPDYSCLQVCCFFNFACYWMMEDGLARSSNPYNTNYRKDECSTDFVFQSLHTSQRMPTLQKKTHSSHKG
jgi:hypothetical protein